MHIFFSPKILSQRAYSQIPSLQNVLSNIEKENSSAHREKLVSDLSESIAKELNSINNEDSLLEYKWHQCKCSPATKSLVFYAVEKDLLSKGFILQRGKIYSTDSNLDYISLRCISPIQLEQEKIAKLEEIQKEKRKEFNTAVLATGDYLGRVALGCIALITFAALLNN